MREERTGPKKKIVNACASRLSGFRPVTNRPFAREVANHDRPGLLPYPSKRRTVDSAQGFDPPRLRNQAKSDWALNRNVDRFPFAGDVRPDINAGCVIQFICRPTLGVEFKLGEWVGSKHASPTIVLVIWTSVARRPIAIHDRKFLGKTSSKLSLIKSVGIIDIG